MQWQKNLYNHEEIPPPGTWDEMKKVLGEEPYQIRQSLNEYSAIPPAFVWENISGAINIKEKPTTQPLLYKIRRASLSYAAAIIGIGLFIAILVFLFNNKTNETGVKDLAAGLNFQDSPLLDNKINDSDKTPEKNEASKSSGEISLLQEKESRSVSQKNSDPISKDITASKTNPISSSVTKAPSNKALSINQKEPPSAIPVKKVSYSDGNYILLSDDSGQTNRVSYKLADMVQSLHEAENIKGISSESAQLWNRKIAEWKQKMGNSTFIPSATNFFDIAEMAEMLNESK